MINKYIGIIPITTSIEIKTSVMFDKKLFVIL